MNPVSPALIPILNTLLACRTSQEILNVSLREAMTHWGLASGTALLSDPYPELKTVCRIGGHQDWEVPLSLVARSLPSERFLELGEFDAWLTTPLDPCIFPSQSGVLLMPFYEGKVALFLLCPQGDALDEATRASLVLLSHWISERLSYLEAAQELATVQDLYGRLQKEKESIERMASLGTFVAGLAHEIKNPLVSIRTLAQLLPENYDDPEFRGAFSRIALQEVERINILITELMDFARSSEPRMGPVDLGCVLREALESLGARIRQGNVRVKLECSDSLPPMNGDDRRLTQVFHNLLVNGIEAMPVGGEIWVRTSYRDNRICVILTDTGVGIPQEEQIRIFEPFYTTKPSGTGLGLTLCRKIVEEHRGEILITSRSHEGTTFTLFFPVVNDS